MITASFDQLLIDSLDSTLFVSFVSFRFLFSVQRRLATMLRICRTATLFRKASTRHGHRFLHEDSSSRGGNFVGFSLSNPHTIDSRFGMDMTHAPGYEVAAEDDPPLVGNQRMVDFAIRHARLSSAEVDNGEGYIWVGNVLYPSGLPDGDFSYSWEADDDIESDLECIQVTPAPQAEPDTVTKIDEPLEQPKVVEEETTKSTVEAKRRYTGGQARRIRKERERNATKRTVRSSNRRPIRKPHNDIPKDEES